MVPELVKHKLDYPDLRLPEVSKTCVNRSGMMLCDMDVINKKEKVAEHGLIKKVERPRQLYTRKGHS